MTSCLLILCLWMARAVVCLRCIRTKKRDGACPSCWMAFWEDVDAVEADPPWPWPWPPCRPLGGRRRRPQPLLPGEDVSASPAAAPAALLAAASAARWRGATDEGEVRASSSPSSYARGPKPPPPPPASPASPPAVPSS